MRQLLFLESLTIVERFSGYLSAVYSKFYNKPRTKNLAVFREIEVVIRNSGDYFNIVCITCISIPLSLGKDSGE